MTTGTFTLSLDVELLWGTVDKRGARFEGACRLERAQLIDRLLILFARYGISATWCVVGHLMLENCPSKGPKHPEIVRPQHSWVDGDWFAHDPGGDERTAPLHFAPSLVERIGRCAVGQEIGSHSFSHVIFGDVGCSHATAESEVRACVAAGAARGLSLRSFVFPRNSVGHLDVLRSHGFTCYRGPEPTRRWGRAPVFVRRAAHIIEVLGAVEPPVVEPIVEDGLVNIPASMIFLPAHGIRRHIPIERRVTRALRGLTAAERECAIFHLWFHPTNMAEEPEAMFTGLEQVLRAAAVARDQGRLAIETMGRIADVALQRAAGAAA